jgi:AGCS family alanine or glycine:cation symporter
MKKILLTVFFIFFFVSNQFASDTIKTKQDKISSTYKEKTLSEKINDAFTPLVDFMDEILFWDPFAAIGLYDPIIRDENGNIIYDENGGPKKKRIPLVVFWLILGATTFTIYFKFINITGFKHSLQLVAGKYDNPKDKGEVSHFQALTTALSATVGLGNIAGVAIAITLGGPGATFWMILAGFLGMTSKFLECTLGLKYRKIDENGEVSGGPMYYLRDGLKKYKLGGLGKFLAILFALLVIGGSFGGGNMFQANQSFAQVKMMIPSLAPYGAYFGIIMAILVGIVVIGGIKSIAKVTDKIVPFMAALYITAALVIIFMNYSKIDDAILLIWNGALKAEAIKGGIIGVMIVGFQRAAFSNEAGIGSASIAHSAAKTPYPISEGLVALLEPFIDTVVICTMTAFVIIITGYYQPEIAMGHSGSQLTSMAFQSAFPWFPWVLMLAIFLFAFSTMISWSYYGLNGFRFLFEKPLLKIFKTKRAVKNTYYVFFLTFIVIGSASNLGAVMDFSDMMIFSMAFPNVLGLIILAPEVKRDLNDYLKKLKNGEIKKYK